MNSIPRLLCLATLATAAFAQTPAPFVTSDPSLAGDSQTTKAQPEASAPEVTSPGTQPELQTRSNYEHTMLPTATVLRLKLDRVISTASARPGQQFTATLTRPVEVDGRTIIPDGATVNCSVKRAHGARRFAGKPSLSIKAHSIRMPSGEELSFSASVVDTANPHKLDVDQEGSVRGASPNPMDKLELGSLTGVGAVAGALIAGPEGFLIGTASGAIVATGHILVKHRDLTLPAGTELILELDAPSVTSRPQMGGMQ
jgi:hypothetical protein